MKNSIKILLIFSVLLLTSCQNQYTLEDITSLKKGNCLLRLTIRIIIKQ